jgi:endonuclease YncB( thermonuclease family)
VGIASVVDGDTIEIHDQRIRLSGFDTPESGKRCGDTNVYQSASLALSDFIANRTVTCTPTGTDRYDRVTATCSVGGTDLGDYVVSQGWGRDWPRYSNGAYADEEAAARAGRRGLWALSCPADLWGDRDYSR